MMPVHIRSASGPDREDIRDVYMRAFPESENQLVAGLATNLLDEKTEPETISLVAETGGGIAGHIAFSPVAADGGSDWRGYILAPLGVKPEHHKLGIGSKLVESGIKLLSRKEVDVVFVYGDPKFYGRFGFSAQAAARFIPPFALKHPFGWQARALHGGDPDHHAVRLSCVQSLRDPALW